MTDESIDPSEVRRSRMLATVGAAVLAVSCLLLLRAVVDRAWIGEDAFITFRTIDNFVEGYGLHWNVDERVQTYTHPLWLLINLPLYAILRDIPWTATAVGLICTAAAFLVAGVRHRRRPLVIAVGLFVPLVSSLSFLRYSTSGFENSLTHLCFAGFALLYLRALDREKVAWAGLAVVAALGVTNRIDTALVYAPPLVVLLLLHLKSVPWRRFLVGFSPVFVWFAFSTIYYGFPYPNTAPAKLFTGIPEDVLFERGVQYFREMMRSDPAGFVVMLSGAGIGLGVLVQAVVGFERRRSLGIASLGLGVIAYASYVVNIGGTWTAGRYWSLPVFVGAILIAEQLAVISRAVGRFTPASWRMSTSRLVKTPALAVLVVSLVVSSVYFATQRSSVPRKSRTIRVMPDAAMYLRKTGEWRMTRKLVEFESAGAALRGQQVAVFRAVGIAGIAADRTIIVDPYALTDPLLARLPAERRPSGNWGGPDHYLRHMPPGYLHARVTGSLEAMPQSLAGYYAPLRLIITGPIFDAARLRALVAFNLGAYDHYRDAYLAEVRPDGTDSTSGR